MYTITEPSTGLDPLSRRQLWDMINWMKEDRVVILTTHSMEEADVLGDSIIILHGGRVKAMGDSLFLKSTYGTGYQLTLVVERTLASVMKDFVLQVRKCTIVRIYL